MTESIVQMERAASEQQAVARAVQNLQRAGVEDASPETVEFLSKNFEPLQKMRGLLKQYGDTINTITDNIDADEEERVEAYSELRTHVIPQYEEAAAQLKADIRRTREQYQQDVFGIPENSAPSATPADRNTAAMSYRDALYRLQDATPEELDKAATIAEGTGDMALLRAVGFMADQRGDINTTYRYLQRAGQNVHEKFTARNMLPTESTIGALVSSFAPPRIGRAELAPNAHVLEGRRRKETQKAQRNSRLFRR